MHVQAREQYEVPSREVNAYNVENAAAYVKPYCSAGIIGAKCFILHAYKLIYRCRCLYVRERSPYASFYTVDPVNLRSLLFYKKRIKIIKSLLKKNQINAFEI